MHTLEVILDGDGAYPDLAEKKQAGKLIEDTTGAMLVSVAGLPQGTSGGRPAVIFRIDLPDGTTVLTQTTMRIFVTAARAFVAKYGGDL